MVTPSAISYAFDRIGESLRSYSAEQGWNEQERKFFAWVNSEWGNVHVLIAIDQIADSDYLGLYMSIMGHLKHDLADDPGLVSALGLSIEPLSEVAADFIANLRDNLVEI